MKFNNGEWMMQKGVEGFFATEVYFTKITENCVELVVPTHPVAFKGATLMGPNLKIYITAPMEETFRIQSWHYMGGVDREPKFELDLTHPGKMQVTEERENIVILNGSMKLVIQKNPWQMTWYRGEEKITSTGFRDMAYLRKDYPGPGYEDGGYGKAFMREQLSLSVGENVYGMGERFNALVKNGQVVDIWNEDGGTSSQQSYKNIPFYITNRGYGIFVNNPGKVSFEVAAESVTKVSFSVPGEHMDYFLFNGPTMKDVLMRYTDLTGKPGLPKPWTFGLWLSTSFTTDYDEATVNEFVDGMLERDIPLKVFHFDCFWMKDYHWSNFLWDERVFPEPEKMLRRLKEKGLKICVWINSYVGQESELFQEGMEKGYFLKRASGDVWQWDMWQPGLAIVDFTNPAACEWYASKLEALLDMGVDCFKTDFGERIPTDAVYYNGANPESMHNYYTYLYNKTVYDVLEKKRGKGEAVLFARSATAGGQKFPVHWGGDCNSTYEAMEESLRGGLSLTMSGFGFWSHDIGGFESKSSPDVYKRWVAFGLLSSHSRLHGSDSYRVPWLYDEESVEVLRYFAKLKESLMPYLYSEAVKTAETGISLMRSMVVEFTEDRNCTYLDKQYMLGDSLLVSPIFNEKGIAEYYLPSGKWINYFTNEIVDGGEWMKEHHDYMSIPLLVRENSIVPVKQKDGITLKLYAIKEGESVCNKIYDENGAEAASITAQETEKEIQIKIQNFQKDEIDFSVEMIHCSKTSNQVEKTGDTEGEKILIFEKEK